MKIDFTIAKCKTKATFSAKLKKPSKLDLAKIRTSFEVIVDTPIVVVVKIENIEVIVHGFGELLFKQEAKIELLEQIARKIYAIGLENQD